MGCLWKQIRSSALCVCDWRHGTMCARSRGQPAPQTAQRWPDSISISRTSAAGIGSLRAIQSSMRLYQLCLGQPPGCVAISLPEANAKRPARRAPAISRACASTVVNSASCLPRARAMKPSPRGNRVRGQMTTIFRKPLARRSEGTTARSLRSPQTLCPCFSTENDLDK